MSKLKLVTILGTRPEIIKLSEVIKLADNLFEHILVHTGQNWDYTLNEIFFKDLGLREPNYYLNSVGNDLGSTIGNIISKSYELLNKIKPDAVLILGDTNSALSAISAKRLKIPIFHMEAGNRCFDQNLPEEINRKIVDHISDVNIAYSENARRNLIAEGIDRQFLFVSGSPMKEILNVHNEKIKNSLILKELNLEQEKYFILSAHREENIDNQGSFLSLMNSINGLAEQYQLPIIYSMHPRAKKYIEDRNFTFNPLVRQMKPFGFFDYVHLQKNSLCVLSDSGTLAEESAILKFRAVSLRTSTERQEVMDQGSMVIGGITQEEIYQSIEFLKNCEKKQCKINLTNDYESDNVSIKICNLIQSYVGIVNKMVWRKY